MQDWLHEVIRPAVLDDAVLNPRWDKDYTCFAPPTAPSDYVNWLPTRANRACLFRLVTDR